MTMPAVADDAPNVTDLDPFDQHAAVAAELARMTDGYRTAYGPGFEGSRAQAALAGRRALLDRHRPQRRGAQRACCPPCTSSLYYTGRVPWPCVDYADAAAGLVDGLPAPDLA